MRRAARFRRIADVAEESSRHERILLGTKDLGDFRRRQRVFDQRSLNGSLRRSSTGRQLRSWKSSWRVVQAAPSSGGSVHLHPTPLIVTSKEASVVCSGLNGGGESDRFRQLCRGLMSRSLKFIAALAAASPFWRRSMVGKFGKFGSAGKLPKARGGRGVPRTATQR